MGGWHVNQLVFVDKSGVNPRTGECIHGWGKKGRIIKHKAPGPRGENFSVLPAMTIDGYIACKIYSGSINGTTFKAFIIDELLPHCNPWPGPNSVIIMDNAKIHNVYMFGKHLMVGCRKGNYRQRL